MVRLLLVPIALVLAATAAGCGSSKHGAAPPTTAAATTGSAPAGPRTSASSAAGPSALQAEANATAAGDIPDNQVFLVFRNGRAGYSIKYPEGWAQQGSADRVTFRDKNNIVRIVVDHGPRPSTASVRADVAGLSGVHVRTAARSVSLAGVPAFKVVYSTESPPNSVTGKRVKLVVDRYYLWKSGGRAVVDLGTPQGVDNVDAYRLMIESFRWR